MSLIDWIIMAAALAGIIGYGLYKSRHQKNLEGYFLDGRSMHWSLVLLGIMGTQASAVTFLSAPGQAYADGMRFVQYYFGLPLAMIVISAFFVPIYHKLKVITAYEYLENRFDVKTRTLSAFLFLLGRGLSTGISIYAPAIIVSSLLGWNIYWTNLLVGGLLIIYTVSGGAKSVAYTQRIQFGIIMTGMAIAAYTAIKLMPDNVSLHEAIKIGGGQGKMNIITTGFESGSFAWGDRYNLLSGLIGGFFLALSYFGTDQSQVGRYLTARSLKESRIGLLLNGIVKVPMQLSILFIGVLVFAFFQLTEPPVFFNQTVVQQAKQTAFADSLTNMEGRYSALFNQNAALRTEIRTSALTDAALQHRLETGIAAQQHLRKQYISTLHEAVPGAEASDTNYIFLYFVTNYLPKGLIGLLIAVIIMAAWGSIAAALNSLASSTIVDIHNTITRHTTSESMAYKLSKWYTLGWGLFCIAVAMFATNMGSLIEAVNVLGSLFYGVILGIFLVAFFMKTVKGHAVFFAAIIGEICIFLIYYYELTSFLWLNLIGVALIMSVSWILQKTVFKGGHKN